MDISIIIISYQTPELLFECIRSIFENHSTLKFEIIVVDNSIGDGSKELILSQFSEVSWIDSGYNAGFARANNIGFSHAQGEYILVLNPDATIKPFFLDEFLTFYKLKNKEFKSQLGFLTCRIKTAVDESLQIGSGRKFISFSKEVKRNPIFIYLNRIVRLKRVRYDPNKYYYINHEVDFVSGACFLIEKLKIIQNKLIFDEDFFLYYEDLELSYQSKKLKLRNFFCGELEIYHVNSASTSKSGNKEAQIKISEYLFYFKRFNKIQYYLMGNLMKFNFLLIGFLLKRKHERNLLSNLETEKQLFNDYFYQIPKKYSKHRVGKVDYLKYDK
jgi:GT2 family glycosyltransferase